MQHGGAAPELLRVAGKALGRGSLQLRAQLEHLPAHPQPSTRRAASVRTQQFAHAGEDPGHCHQLGFPAWASSGSEAESDSGDDEEQGADSSEDEDAGWT